MSIEHIDGFEVFEGDTLIIDQYKISDCMEFFKKRRLKKIWISRFYGYTDNNIDFLKDYDFLKEIKIKAHVEISGLYALKDLEFLSYENLNPSQILDLSCFRKIKTCYLDL